MKIKTVSTQSELPVDIAVISAKNFAEALTQVIGHSEDERIGLVVWAGAGDLIPADIKTALVEPMEHIGYTQKREAKTKVNLAREGLQFSDVNVEHFLKTHFAQIDAHAMRGCSHVFDDISKKSHNAYTSDFLKAFNAASDLECFSRLDRLQTTSDTSFFHRDRLINANECRIFRNVAGAGTVFMEEEHVGIMGYGGQLGLKDARAATAWVLNQWDVGFLIPSKKGGMAHTWPSKDMGVGTGKRHFETMDVTTRNTLFPARA